MTLVVEAAAAEEEARVGFRNATLEVSIADVPVDAAADDDDEEEEESDSNDAIVRVGNALFLDPRQSCNLAMRKCCDKRDGTSADGVSEKAMDSSHPTLPSLHGMRQ
jgi:hypothetical protein